jgi:hypothetical protein
MSGVSCALVGLWSPFPAQPVTAHGVQDLTIKAVFRDIPEVYLQI